MKFLILASNAYANLPALLFDGEVIG